MPDREEAISHLQIMNTWAEFALEKDLNFFEDKHLEHIAEWTMDALALLKEQEPHLITADDFKNADTWGWIPAWCEEKDGSSYWEMITVGALEETKYQYWTSKPTEEQRKAVKWDDD